MSNRAGPGAVVAVGPRRGDLEALADALGIATDPATLAGRAPREAIARRLAGIAADYILGAVPDALGQSLLLTAPLPRHQAPSAITFSGGVSEYIFGYEDRDYGDIAKLLADALRAELARRTTLALIDPGQRIRATVIGASQFTVQVSGKTIHLPRPGVLPATHFRTEGRKLMLVFEHQMVDLVADRVGSRFKQLAKLLGRSGSIVRS